MYDIQQYAKYSQFHINIVKTENKINPRLIMKSMF